MTELIEDEDGAPLQPTLQRGGKLWDLIYEAVRGNNTFAADAADELAIKLSPFLDPDLDDDD